MELALKGNISTPGKPKSSRLPGESRDPGIPVKSTSMDSGLQHAGMTKNEEKKLTTKRRTTMKRITKIMLALGLVLGLQKAVNAATSEQVTITIQPNAIYSLTFSTADVEMDMGLVGLGNSTQTVSPATVTITSNFATTDIRLDGLIANTGAGQDWSFDADTSDQNLDSLAAWATFTSIARSSAPAQGGDYFAGTVPGNAGSDVIDDQNRYVGTSAGGTDLFENSTNFDPVNLDAASPSAQAHLWLYFRLPNSTTDNDPQDVTITLTAVVPN